MQFPGHCGRSPDPPVSPREARPRRPWWQARPVGADHVGHGFRLRPVHARFLEIACGGQRVEGGCLP